MGLDMRRREFITLIGGAMAGWPSAARAQQPNQMKRIGIPVFVENNSAEQARIAAFFQGLQQLGWAVGQNLQVEIRWGAGDTERNRKNVAELVALAPDVILAQGSVTVAALLPVTSTVPIVFVIVPDPVGASFVDSLARPGGNATGFMSFEYGMGAKWLELLKQIAPGTTRVAIVRDPAISSGAGQLGAVQSVAPSFGVEVNPISARDAPELERAITAFARSSNGGLVVTQSGLAFLHRDLIIALAARHKLPAVYYERNFVAAGGLISYGPDFIEQHRQAATYVDRILKGEKPADLPVQAPTKYEMVINLKTAKALGLTVPPSLLTRADEVIE